MTAGFGPCSAKSGDFLQVRVGTGTVPFQAEIRVLGTVSAWEQNEMAEKSFQLKERYKVLHHAPVAVSNL